MLIITTRHITKVPPAPPPALRIEAAHSSETIRYGDTAGCHVSVSTRVLIDRIFLGNQGVLQPVEQVAQPASDTRDMATSNKPEIRELAHPSSFCTHQIPLSLSLSLAPKSRLIVRECPLI